MNDPSQNFSSTRTRQARAALLAIVILFSAAVYFFRVTRNPAGFFVDESSIAYNAYTISQTGRDEFGNAWPLFFRAFGDYKNPVYIYLLALLFKLTGPSILTSRLLSATCGVVTAALLGLLAMRISRRRDVGLIVTLSALLTPWLFEVSRVSLEVALFAPVLALFLLFAQRASTKESWRWIDVAGLGSTLILLTYTYSIGRLLGPLLAVGLLFFLSRRRLFRLLQIWILYALSLVPMFVFQHSHADALTGRFKMISYVSRESRALGIIWTFIKHFFGNLDPRRLLLTGDPNIYQVVHVDKLPALLLATFVLILVGAWTVVRHHRGDAWWRFVVYGLCASLIPASLTTDYFHMLRLVPVLVFLLLLMAPAVERLASARRRWPKVVLIILIVLTVAQGAAIQWGYFIRPETSWSRHLFDADFPDEIFAKAIATPSRPIYIAEPAPTAYVQAYWYAVLNKVPISDFVQLKPDEAPPKDALVISTESGCYRPKILAQAEPYTLYIVDREPRTRAPLPDAAMRAEVSVQNFPTQLRSNEQLRINVRVENLSNFPWPGCERNLGRMNVSLGSRWFDSSGNIEPGGGGRTRLFEDMYPGQVANLLFTVDAHSKPGEYILELDMLQEGVAWFGSKGSKTWRGTVTVR